MDDFIQYILLLIISYLGLLAGIIISYMAKEEIKSGKKYFQILKPIIFVFIVYFFMTYLNIFPVISIILAIVFAGFTFIWDKRMKFINTNILYYSFFSVIIFETKLSYYASIIGVLIFIFGLITASIKSEKLEKVKLLPRVKKILGENIIYIILGLILYFIFRT